MKGGKGAAGHGVSLAVDASSLPSLLPSSSPLDSSSDRRRSLYFLPANVMNSRSDVIVERRLTERSCGRVAVFAVPCFGDDCSRLARLLSSDFAQLLDRKVSPFKSETHFSTCVLQRERESAQREMTSERRRFPAADQRISTPFQSPDDCWTHAFSFATF